MAAQKETTAKFSPLPPAEHYPSIDDYEPEWVRSIEMSNTPKMLNVCLIFAEFKPVVRCHPCIFHFYPFIRVFYRLSLQKPDEISSLPSNISGFDAFSNNNFDATIAKIEDRSKTLVPGLPSCVDEGPQEDIPLESAFEERIQKLLLYLFEREMLDPTVYYFLNFFVIEPINFFSILSTFYSWAVVMKLKCADLETLEVVEISNI